MGIQPSGHKESVSSREVYKSRGHRRSGDGATRAGAGTGTAPVWQTDGHKGFMAGRSGGFGKAW